MKKQLLLFFTIFLCLTLGFGQRTITGTVTDDTGEALIGASVLVKGTMTETITDIDGSYQLDVPDNKQTLVYSYTGYPAKEVITSATNVIDVIMSEGLDLTIYCYFPSWGKSKADKAFGSSVTTIKFNWDGSKTITSEAPLKRN